jgi:hypothetical protein
MRALDQAIHRLMRACGVPSDELRSADAPTRRERKATKRYAAAYQRKRIADEQLPRPSDFERRRMAERVEPVVADTYEQTMRKVG